jgi:hypothetical protein
LLGHRVQDYIYYQVSENMPPFLQIQFIIGDLGYTFNNEIGNFFNNKC